MLCSAPELMVEFEEVEEASEDETKLKEAGHWGFLKHMPSSQSLVLHLLSTRRKTVSPSHSPTITTCLTEAHSQRSQEQWAEPK